MPSIVQTPTSIDPFSVFSTTNANGKKVYSAGLPSYPANFSRDGILTGIISGRSDILESQLYTSANHQGGSYNPITGEEPGKIHHEIPGMSLPGRTGLTTYNACDTTALFLIAAEYLSALEPIKGAEFVSAYKPQIVSAVKYIESHLNKDYLFEEKPPECATGYTLRVTYWKDSILPSCQKLEPTYPVIYPLAHFMAARALNSAARILELPRLSTISENMYLSGITRFITKNYYVAYEDADGQLRQESSDELHALAYINQKYAKLLPLEAIQKRAKALETKVGYLCTPINAAKHLSDKYHGDMVWVFEQTFIHYGAMKFKLQNVADTASKIAPHIKNGQELFHVLTKDDGTTLLTPKGNTQQLWSVATSQYFAGNSPLFGVQWL